MTTLLIKNLIDLTDRANTAQALSKFEELINSGAYANSSLAIILGELVFTQGHMARLKTLVKQNNIEIEVIYSTAVQTQLAALNSGLTVSEKAPGDTILEEFKNSFNSVQDIMKDNLNQQDGQSSDNNPEQQTEQMQSKTENEVADNVENNAVNLEQPSEEEILPGAESVEEAEFNTINDVIEILNTDSKLEQQKIDLPFEVLDPENEVDDKTGKKKVHTLYINQTLRSGQTVTHQGNVVIAGDTHPGSEVVAEGDIVVWGTLGGIAHAGVGGNYKASIRALKLDAIQLRIADYIARRPDKKVDFSKDMNVKPEVARIHNGEIRIFSLK